ncbi:MAG: hypothetical protein V8T10_05970 [Merdibacter sp.]
MKKLQDGVLDEIAGRHDDLLLFLVQLQQQETRDLSIIHGDEEAGDDRKDERDHKGRQAHGHLPQQRDQIAGYGRDDAVQ